MRWRGASGRLAEGEDSRFKIFQVGNDKGMGGVGILLAEKWGEAIFDVKCVSDRIMLIKLVVGKSIVSALSALPVKDLFYENLLWTPGFSLKVISATKLFFVIK